VDEIGLLLAGLIKLPLVDWRWNECNDFLEW